MFTRWSVHILMLYFAVAFGVITRPHEVINLPGLDTSPSFKHYSGYLNGSNEKIQLHYWLLEAQTDPKSKPLILWLNGGPGCSSMTGAFTENGPFMVQKGGKTLAENPYSWNKLGNVLYLEAPGGVGFSYDLNEKKNFSDDATSLNNFEALRNFLEEYPEYKGRDFYITGESYGGIYVPTLAMHFLKNKIDLNLKGIAVGNGLYSYRYNDNRLPYFLNYHGFMDEGKWLTLCRACCSGQPYTQCFFTDNRSPKCQVELANLLDELSFRLNPYNLYEKCVLDKPSASGEALSSNTNYEHPGLGSLFLDNPIVQERRAMRKVNGRTNLKIPCVDQASIETYMNMDSVREALHVRPGTVDQWEMCSSYVYDNYQRQYFDLSEQYTALLKAKIPVLLYAGDLDATCNYAGAMLFVDKLQTKLDKSLHHWLYNDSDDSLQHGGFTKLRNLNGTNLWYVTVRAAGHMVPEDKPVPIYYVINRFLQNFPF